MEALFSHRLNLLSLTWRLGLYFRSAARKTYFPDGPLPFRRRSEVHLCARRRSSAALSPLGYESYARGRERTEGRRRAGRPRCADKQACSHGNAVNFRGLERRGGEKNNSARWLISDIYMTWTADATCTARLFSLEKPSRSGQELTALRTGNGKVKCGFWHQAAAGGVGVARGQRSPGEHLGGADTGPCRSPTEFVRG